MKHIFILTLIFLLFLSFIIYFNQSYIIPTKYEIEALNVSFGDLSINDESSIISIQNKVIQEVKHFPSASPQIDIVNILKSKRGLCYDRSLILQKIFIFNGIKIRPIYIFYKQNGKATHWFDFFDKTILSHSIFEYCYKGNWYAMRTNSKMKKMETIAEYFNSQNGVLKNAYFVRHLSNRNGKFISPWYFPDIY